MCGVTGVFLRDGVRVNEGILKEMTNSLIHRGPDDMGTYIDGNVGLGFRRLSIIDLSMAGHQPMCNEDKTVWMVFNGEIYNYKKLREKLISKGHQFKSNADSEVLVHLYEEYGVDCLEHLDGMFAFAIWDTKKQRLFLARDRFGIKPLNYYYKDGTFAFGSEIKAITKLPGLDLTVDQQSIWNYLSYMQVPAPRSIYKNIRKLLPGQAMLLTKENGLKVWQYYTLTDKEDVKKSEEEWLEELIYLYRKSIEKHLISDVPIGVFLSGGVDSSSIVSIASEFSEKPLNTFSARFSATPQYDESEYQRIVAKKHKTNHFEFDINVNSLSNIEPLLLNNDEPYAVTSAIPLYLISKEAAKHVKVVLTGDGGDELFAGYKRYKSSKAQSISQKVPKFIWSSLFGLSNLVPYNLSNSNNFLRRIKKFSYMGTLSNEHFFLNSFSFFPPFEKRGLLKKEITNQIISEYDPYYEELFQGRPINGISSKLHFDVKTSMADEMLKKSDFCTSLVSLEGRVPMLDKDFVEAAFSIPSSFKVKGTEGKYILKKALEKTVPNEILYRKKAGFNVPINDWMREMPFEEIMCYKDSVFDERYVKSLYQANKKGKVNWGLPLWIIFILNRWFKDNNISQ